MPLDPLAAAFAAVEDNADLLAEKVAELADAGLREVAGSIALETAGPIAHKAATETAEKVATNRLPSEVADYIAAHPPAKGDKGVQGEAVKGDEGPEGPPGLVWRGPFIKGQTYQRTEAVSWEGSSYIAIRATKATPPNGGWQLLAKKGAKGEPGTTQPMWVGGGGSSGVTSVNGQTGVVVIQLANLPASATAADIIAALIAAGLMVAPTTVYWPMLSLTSG